MGCPSDYHSLHLDTMTESFLQLVKLWGGCLCVLFDVSIIWEANVSTQATSEEVEPVSSVREVYPRLSSQPVSTQSCVRMIRVKQERAYRGPTHGPLKYLKPLFSYSVTPAIWKF